jgi:hypothetical protein
MGAKKQDTNSLQLDLHKLYEVYKNNEIKKEKIKDFDLVVGLGQRVAKSCSKEEFVKFMKTGEVPTIKLSQHEMQLLKGGGMSFGTRINNFMFKLDHWLPTTRIGKMSGITVSGLFDPPKLKSSNIPVDIKPAMTACVVDYSSRGHSVSDAVDYCLPLIKPKE